MAAAPPTPAEDVVEIVHGVEVRDPYRWLEDPESSSVRAWVASQQGHARAVLDADPRRNEIARRLEVALEAGMLGGMQPRGPYRLFTRRTAGMNQLALYVLDAGSGERLLLDPGPLSSDGATALDWWYPSLDGALVAAGVSEAGGEDSTLMLIETATGRLLADRIPGCRLAAVAFEPGGKALVYTRYPARGTVPPGDELYNRHVFRHVIGADPALDEEVFGAGRDPLDYPVLVSISRNGRWMVITIAQGWSRTAVFLRDGSGAFQPIFEGDDKELVAEFSGDRLLGRTNLGAPNYRLVEIDPERPRPESWRELVAESDHVLLGAEISGGRLLVHHLVDACSSVAEHELDGTLRRRLELPPLTTVTAIGADTEQPAAYLTVEGFTHPATILEHLPGAERLNPVAAVPPPAGFDPGAHPVRQVFFSSSDGTSVPMFLVGRQSGPGPAVLTGYGGFNVARTPVWSPSIVPFLEEGGLFAVANLRGGSEYGESWHRAGMLANKQNVFEDFIGAAEWLIRAGLATPRTLGILGGSNGGLLVGAAMTQRPELFGAVVCRVPLLDMVRYEQFKVARLWASEYGTAEDEEGFTWLYAYSPYHHVRDGIRYPPVLLTAGEQDTRVDPMHARKMAARLQAADPDGETLLRIEPRAGHGQGKPVTKLVPEEADVWSFLLRRLRT